jgi:hypothetical protein
VIKRESLDRVNGEKGGIDVELEGIKQSIKVCFDLVGYAPDPTLVVELRSQRRHFVLP